MIFSGMEISPSTLQQTKLCDQKSMCFTPQTEPRSFGQKTLCFQKIKKKTLFLLLPKLGAIIRNKESKEYAK